MENIKENFGDIFSEYFKKFWKRFHDDIFILWNKSKDDLDTLNEILNSLHSDLNFTMEFSMSELPFLDINVILESNEISTDIHYKPTDSKQYLLFNSCHPKHTR